MFVRARAYKVGEIAMRLKFNNIDKLFDEICDLNFG